MYENIYVLLVILNQYQQIKDGNPERYYSFHTETPAKFRNQTDTSIQIMLFVYTPCNIPGKHNKEVSILRWVKVININFNGRCICTVRSSQILCSEKPEKEFSFIKKISFLTVTRSNLYYSTSCQSKVTKRRLSGRLDFFRQILRM